MPMDEIIPTGTQELRHLAIKINFVLEALRYKTFKSVLRMIWEWQARIGIWELHR
jgi:hypothetical protein